MAIKSFTFARFKRNNNIVDKTIKIAEEISIKKVNISYCQ
jgi:hypothetical protein